MTYLLFRQEDVDFILCVGDGKTDEVVFNLLKGYKSAVTCTVGKKQTEGSFTASLTYILANYYLESVQDVSALLFGMTA